MFFATENFRQHYRFNGQTFCDSFMNLIFNIDKFKSGFAHDAYLIYGTEKFFGFVSRPHCELQYDIVPQRKRRE